MGIWSDCLEKGGVELDFSTHLERGGRHLGGGVTFDGLKLYDIWHTVKCCEHWMYYLHKINLTER